MLHCSCLNIRSCKSVEFPDQPSFAPDSTATDTTQTSARRRSNLHTVSYKLTYFAGRMQFQIGKFIREQNDSAIKRLGFREKYGQPRILFTRDSFSLYFLSSANVLSLWLFESPFFLSWNTMYNCNLKIFNCLF